MRTIKKFKRLIVVLTAEIILDCLFALLDGKNVDVVFLYVIKFSELLLNPCLALLVFDIFFEVDKTKNKRHKSEYFLTMVKIRNIITLLVVFNGILLSLMVFGWNVFTIDEANFYRRGILTPVYLTILGLSIAALIWGLVLFSRNSQSSLKSTLFFFASTIVVGIILRDIFPKTNYDFLCISVSVSFLLIYYSHITLRLDPLTKLLNRQVYMRMFERVNYTTVVIAIDANNFKHINDTYGHECGDRTLKQIAKLIHKAYGKNAHCFRTGGDEFCVILKQGVFEELIEETPHFDAYALAKNLTEDLSALIGQPQKDSQIHLEFGVSQGTGVFYSPETHGTISLSERKSFREVVEIADRNMYKAKEEFKNQQLPLTDP